MNLENILFTITMFLYLFSMIGYVFFFALKKEMAGKLAGYAALAGFILHTAALIVRGIGAGRLPMTNQYEFATSFAWGICLCFLVFLWKYKFRALGTFVMPVIFIIIGYAAMQSREVRDLMPALRSNWLAIHVSSAIVSYGAFGVSFAVSLMYLIRTRMAKDSFWDEHIPDQKKLDMISYRAVSLGFLFLTFVIVTGAIWAERAWGSYWSWDPKETWSLITWIIYAIYLHLRISRGWKDKNAAVFAVVGFICVIFTYIGVNTWLPGIHSYA
ncbi:MAG: c-type cytochrome biogenesis protein CcsB [Blautia sp.]|nr:c-type cytochrome biogenesis protein CcsB [Blautia sp.]